VCAFVALSRADAGAAVAPAPPPGICLRRRPPVRL